jgi:hypothetical protein
MIGIRPVTQHHIKPHSIGYCTNCGWVHTTIFRVSVEEGGIATIKALCSDCIKKRTHQVICDLCGRTRGDNLYPVSITRRVMEERVCNLFVHLCAECRKIPHNELLKRFKVPDDICNSCKDKFICFTTEGGSALPSIQQSAIVDGKRTTIHVNWMKKLRNRIG